MSTTSTKEKSSISASPTKGKGTSKAAVASGEEQGETTPVKTSSESSLESNNVSPIIYSPPNIRSEYKPAYMTGVVGATSANASLRALTEESHFTGVDESMLPEGYHLLMQTMCSALSRCSEALGGTTNDTNNSVELSCEKNNHIDNYRSYAIIWYFSKLMMMHLRHRDQYYRQPLAASMSFFMDKKKNCEIRKSTIDGANEGVFLVEGHDPLKPWSVIGIYGGYITYCKKAPRVCKECNLNKGKITATVPGYEDKYWPCSKYHMNDMVATNGKVELKYIISGDRRHISTKINHCCNSDPRCNLLRVGILSGAKSDIPQFLFLAKREIAVNEELFYDYFY